MRHHLSLEDQAYLSDLKNVGVGKAVPFKKKTNDIDEVANLEEDIIHWSSLESFQGSATNCL